ILGFLLRQNEPDLWTVDNFLPIWRVMHLNVEIHIGRDQFSGFEKTVVWKLHARHITGFNGHSGRQLRQLLLLLWRSISRKLAAAFIALLVGPPRHIVSSLGCMRFEENADMVRYGDVIRSDENGRYPRIFFERIRNRDIGPLDQSIGRN